MALDRLTVASGRFESPLFRCFHGLVIQTELRIEGLNHLEVANRSVCQHDRFNENSAFNLRGPRLRRVDGMNDLDGLWRERGGTFATLLAACNEPVEHHQGAHEQPMSHSQRRTAPSWLNCIPHRVMLH